MSHDSPPARNSLRWILIGAFLLWVILVTSSYFVVNRPTLPAVPDRPSNVALISSQTVPAMVRALGDIAVAAWITLAALGLGASIWRRLAIAEKDSLLTVIFGAGLGLGTLGLVTLLLGIAGLITRPVFLVLLTGITLFTAPRLPGDLRGIRWQLPPVPVSLYLFLLLALTATMALLPPTSWDGLFYHLKGPDLYLQAGRINPGIDIPHLNFPSLFEMLLLMGMALRGDIAAKLLHFVYLLLLGGVVLLFSKRLLKLNHSWLSLVFLLSTPLVLTVAAWSYNDLALAFYGLAALFALIRWRQEDNGRWLLAGGLFSGFMMGLKYTSIVPTLFLVGYILWHKRRDLASSLRALITFCLPAAALVAPWLLKNWAFTGNPVYPFIFEGRYWDAFRAAAYSDAGTGIGLDPVALLRLPFDMTLGYADASQEAAIGPFYLIFLPLLIFFGLGPARRRVPPAFLTILAYTLTLYLFWTVGVINSAGLWQARLLLPGIVALCPLLAWILEDLARYDHEQFSLQGFLRLAIIFVTAMLLLSPLRAWLQHDPLAYLTGAESRTTYLQRTLGAHYVVMDEMNRLLPDGATVVFLWEPRSYYCRHDCRPDSILDRFAHLQHQYGSAEGIAGSWREEGVSHVLIFDAGLSFIRELGDDSLPAQADELLDILQTEYLTPVRKWQGAYTLYTLSE